MNTAAKTARARSNPSRPLRALLEGYPPDTLQEWYGPFLDYGCGRGADLDYLRSIGPFDVEGYDPYQPGFDNPCVLQAGPFELVYSIYVYNVIRDFDEAQRYWEDLSSLAQHGGLVFVASRTPHEVAKSLKVSLRDALGGVTTSKGTFQKGYSHADIGLMGQSVGLESIKYFGTRSTFSGVLFRKP